MVDSFVVWGAAVGLLALVMLCFEHVAAEQCAYPHLAFGGNIAGLAGLGVSLCAL